MLSDIKQFLKPELINSVADLELIARMIAENLSLGITQSINVGFGQEFSQYRSYEPGDDLRYLDWKLFARNDRYFVRQSDIDANINVRFIVDCSASMNHIHEGISKLDFAKILVATFAYIAIKQHDTIILHGIQGDEISRFETTDAQQSLHRLLYHLIQLNGAHQISVRQEDVLKSIHSTRNELVIFISDMYQKESELSKLMESIFKSKADVILFHLIAKNELDMDLSSSINIQDLESHESIMIHDIHHYYDQLQSFLSNTEAYVQQHQGTYQLFSSYHDIHQVVRTFLKKRDQFR